MLIFLVLHDSAVRVTFLPTHPDYSCSHTHVSMTYHLFFSLHLAQSMLLWFDLFPYLSSAFPLEREVDKDRKHIYLIHLSQHLAHNCQMTGAKFFSPPHMTKPIFCSFVNLNSSNTLIIEHSSCRRSSSSQYCSNYSTPRSWSYLPSLVYFLLFYPISSEHHSFPEGLLLAHNKWKPHYCPLE